MTDDSSSDTRWHGAWLGLISLLYCAPAIGALRPVDDPDIWWHLRTAQWIVDHRTVPSSDPSFSAYGGGTFWVAYSWLAEIALYGLYRWLGLVGLVVYATVIAIVLTATLHALMLQHYVRIARATAFTALLVAGMATGFAPRTYLVSMLLMTIEVAMILAARRRRNATPLLLMPALFAVWANVHLQFVYGLVVLALAMAESVIVRRTETDAIDRSSTIPTRPIVLVTVACCVATLLNPYHVYLYRAVLDIAGQTGVWNWIIDLKAMDFRQPADWLVLGWTLAAAFALGRSRRIPVFPALFFVLAVFLSFRARRDVWLVVLASGVTVALTSAETGARQAWLTWRRGLIVVAAVVAVTVLLAFARDITPRGLERHVSRHFPARAAAAIDASGYQGRLFNPYDWGGYLMWRLPTHQVSIDPRSNIHGDARIARSLQTWLGETGWDTDAELRDAQLVVGPTYIALTSLLRLDPRFRLVHEDDVATVFVARDARPSQR